jgi:hypothetical protein
MRTGQNTPSGVGSGHIVYWRSQLYRGYFQDNGKIIILSVGKTACAGFLYRPSG